MKRSEVEKLIRDVITAEEGRAISYRVVIDHILPEKILDALLEVGMLPPIIYSNGVNHFEECTRDHLIDCEWEDE